MSELQIIMEAISKLGDSGVEAFKWYLFTQCVYYFLTFFGLMVPVCLGYRVTNYAVRKVWEVKEKGGYA